MRAKLPQSFQLFATLWTCSPLGSSFSMGFSRQEYWSGLPCSSLGIMIKLALIIIMREQAFIDADYIPYCIMNTLYVLSSFIFTKSLEVASWSLYCRWGNRGTDRLNAYSELSNWDANILMHFWSLCSSLLCQAASTKKSDLRKYLTGQEPSIWETVLAWCWTQFLINLKFITFLISARHCFR